MYWYLEVLKKYAVFNGRARRQEFWTFLLFNLLALIVLVSIDGAVGLADQSGAGLLSGLYALAVLIPGLAVAVRRLHDTNHSGWWLLVGVVPLVGVIILLIFLVRDSDGGENQYDLDPAQAGAQPLTSSEQAPSAGFWKAYFVLGAVALIYGALVQGTAPWDLIDVAVNAVGLVGLFAYAWRKDLLSASFWKVLLPIIVAWNVAHLYFLPISPRVAELMGVGDYPRPVVATLNLAALMPLFVALYRQGFKGPGPDRVQTAP